MSLGKIAMTKEALWTWIRSKVNNHESRITDLEGGGGSPPGSSITLAGDVTGDSSFNTVVQIVNVPIVGVPDTNGKVLIYDNNDVNFIWGVAPFSNIETFTGDGNISDSSQLVIADLTGLSTVVTLVLPNLRKHMQLIYVKVIGQGSIGTVTINAGGASNGFDPVPLSASITELANNSVGTVIVLCGDLTNNCWWNLGVNYL